MNDPRAHAHAQALTSEERQRLWPNVRPRDAATLIIIDRTGPVPKVLMGKRHHAHKFMPGKFVFPGGRIERSDGRMSVALDLQPQVEARLMKALRSGQNAPHRARALALAALRETFEETGVLIGLKGDGATGPVPEGPWSRFVEEGVVPDLSHLHFIARAITPPRRPKRFDARFFAVDARHIAVRLDNIIGPDTELVDLVWQPLDKIAELDLPSITKVVLKELDARAAAGFGHELATPFYHERHRRWQRDEL